ncbi:hypothetical protein AB0D67_15695 [Streptosporangium sp. NPDC048047]|uniref:hypothetical protein n=1 Tax=Streptosporangium sp. NPDC048047 TaxID=3155748 RepID=UPI003447A028
MIGNSRMPGRHQAGLTPTTATTSPNEHEQALTAAAHLVGLLITRHNIPADVHNLPQGVVVSVFYGLVAHVESVIWWTIPNARSTRHKPLKTYAHSVETAADRLAKQYRDLRSVPLPELLATGRITFLAAALIEGRDRDAAPV